MSPAHAFAELEERVQMQRHETAVIADDMAIATEHLQLWAARPNLPEMDDVLNSIIFHLHDAARRVQRIKDLRKQGSAVQ